MKKNLLKIGKLSIALVLSFMMVGNVSYAKGNKKDVFDEISKVNVEKLSKKDIEKVRQKINKELDKLPVYEDKKAGKSDYAGLKPVGSNSYPRRPGVILVTSDGTFGSLVGHAGIVWSYHTTIESFPKGGVGRYPNDWDKRYNRVWGVTTYKLNAYQEDQVSNWCDRQVGKPYNWNFAITSFRSRFYCSHLVYAGFLDKYDLNLNYGYWIVFPYDLVRTNNTYTIYKK